MRHFAVFCAIATLSGCMLLTEDETSDERGGQHKLTINFHLKGPGNAPVQCPAGFENLLLSATTEEAEGQVQTLIPCSSTGSATMDLFTNGERKYTRDGETTVYTERFSENYNFVLYLTDPTGFVERATSLETHLKLDHDQTIEVDLYPDAGILLFSWQLYSDITSARVYACPAVAIDEIELAYRKFTPTGDPPAPSSKVRWPCNEIHPPYYISDEATGQGFLPALAPDDYLADMIGYRGGVEVARTPDISFNIRTGNGLTETQAMLTVPDR